MGVVVNVRLGEANIRALRDTARATQIFDMVCDNVTSRVDWEGELR
jgi:hypothetical protein